MTEKEKMLSGQLYDANDAALARERDRAKKLCRAYNELSREDAEGRRALLEELLGRVGKACWIEPSFWCDYGGSIELGENFYANHNLVILDAGGVRICENVLLGPNCGLYTSGHPLDAARRNAGWEYALPIVIGDNVWIGGGAQLLPGVTIGSNVVIGAGSVVTHDIPDHCVAVGNPCRVLRRLPEDGEISAQACKAPEAMV